MRLHNAASEAGMSILNANIENKPIMIVLFLSIIAILNSIDKTKNKENLVGM
ncbi:hypothetical protein YTPLAS73_00430 [Nitrosarchaeum sp.]|nr:hypothetical protein YTPLAS73_00430 [Nitrosarchaeum sp.]